MSEDSELQKYDNISSATLNVEHLDDLNLGAWGKSPLFCATTDGTGKDNPQDPYELTPLQRSRSVLLTLQNHKVIAMDVFRRHWR